ncbi:hypothetical protein Micbo1qcDRAFT_181129 [Microdochium bolleyi]|uniref:Uncharacterized protein n=1 Tax=Microdochium bolleyi TaxID=196109 RepID=A0A136IKB7_9PEZI|nr:hypothetical protein Micbo1qcDRAFT_181129 [Microdochium bolleyi]
MGDAGRVLEGLWGDEGRLHDEVTTAASAGGDEQSTGGRVWRRHRGLAAGGHAVTGQAQPCGAAAPDIRRGLLRSTAQGTAQARAGGHTNTKVHVLDIAERQLFRPTVSASLHGHNPILPIVFTRLWLSQLWAEMSVRWNSRAPLVLVNHLVSYPVIAARCFQPRSQPPSLFELSRAIVDRSFLGASLRAAAPPHRRPVCRGHDYQQHEQPTPDPCTDSNRPRRRGEYMSLAIPFQVPSAGW